MTEPDPLVCSTEQLLVDIEKFLAVHGIRHTVFSRDVMNDHKFVSRLRTGKRKFVFPTTERHIRNWMAAYRPPPQEIRAAA